MHPSARIASKICSVCGLKSCRYTHSSSKMLHIPLQTRELINVYIWRGANYPHPSDTTLLNTSNLKMTLQLRVHSRTPAPVGFFSRGGQIRFLRAKVPQRGQGWSPVPTEAENNACINNSYIERFAVTTRRNAQNTSQHCQKGKGQVPLLSMPADAHGNRQEPLMRDFFAVKIIKRSVVTVTARESRAAGENRRTAH